MRVLITGGGGFIGSHLVDSQLAQGHQVSTIDLHIDRLVHAKGHPNLEIIIGDIQDPDLVRKTVKGIEVIYHLASAHLDVSLSDAYYHQVNVDAVSGLLEAARKAGTRRFVHCSSVGVIGDVKNPPANETTPCHPTNVYEQTKLAGEQAAMNYANKTGFEVVVARPAWVYGARCPRTAKLIGNVRKGHFVFFGNGRNLRHPIYITDAVRGLELCAGTSGVEGEVYIIAGERPVTTDELVGSIAEALSIKSPFLHLPHMLLVLD